jgi:hypothetical protein
VPGRLCLQGERIVKSYRILFVLGAALLTCSAVLAAGVKSGPQVDQQLPGPFEPLNVTGEAAGQKYCLYCSNGVNPVAMIFAREITPAVTRLLREIDTATAKNAGASMGSFVVFCANNEGLEKQLKELAKKESLKKIVLAIDNPAGPEDYKIAKEADVTVVLYVERTVKANYAFKKGELAEKDVETVVKDLSKILPKSK